MSNRCAWNGEDYSINSSSQQTRAHHALSSISFHDNWEILDVGCGDGKITSFMAQKVPLGKVIGLDKDPSMIKKAKELEKKIKNLRFIQGDAKDFQLGQKFDLITSFFCLQWLSKENFFMAVKNIHHHLKENGQTCIMLPCFDMPHEIITNVAFSDKWKKHFDGYHEPQTFLNNSEYNYLFEQAEFTQVRLEMEESEHLITDQEFIDFTRQWCGYYTFPQDTRLREDFVADLLSHLRSKDHDFAGKFKMIQKSMHIVAEKSQLLLRDDPDSEGYDYVGVTAKPF